MDKKANFNLFKKQVLRLLLLFSLGFGLQKSTLCQESIGVSSGLFYSNFFSLIPSNDYTVNNQSDLGTTTSLHYLYRNKNNRIIGFQLDYSELDIHQTVDHNEGKLYYINSIDYSFKSLTLNALSEKEIFNKKGFLINAQFNLSLSHFFNLKNSGYETYPIGESYIDSLGFQNSRIGSFDQFYDNSSYNLNRYMFGLNTGIRLEYQLHESLHLSLTNNIAFGLTNVTKSQPFTSLKTFRSQLGINYRIKKKNAEQ